MRSLVLVMFLGGCIGLILTGCAGSQKSLETTPENRELSLQHFLEGSLHDQKGEYAQAILEYQEAIRYKQDAAIYQAIAKDYAILTKNDRAIEMALEAVKLAPNNKAYHETLAEVYVNAFDYENAGKEFSAIIKIDSSDRQGWSNLAHLTQMKNPGKALELYRQMIDRFGPDQDAYFQMARIYDAENKLDKAAEAVKGMLILDPGNFEMEKTLGDLYLRQDSIDAALRIYNDLVELHPEQLEIRAAIAHAYLVKQDYPHATQQFDIVLKKDTLSVEDQIRFGQVFVSFIQKDSLVAPYALTMFEKIRTNYPGDWRPYWFLGAINNILRKDSIALTDFKKVTELSRTNPDGWMGIATIYYDRNNFDDAIRVLTEAQQYLRDEFRVYFLLGLSYQRKQQLPEAATALEKAVQLNEKSVDAMSSLALVYDEMKRKQDSDTLYEHALQIDAHNHLVLNNYAYSLAERNQSLERALRMSKEALEQQPENQSYLDTYGWIYYQMGRYDEAEKYTQKAVELGSTSAVILEHLGDINYKLSRKEKALEYWKKALELDSSNEGLKGKIQRGSL
jgi:tetratricopeptide (TPR) repeat protein